MKRRKGKRTLKFSRGSKKGKSFPLLSQFGSLNAMLPEEKILNNYFTATQKRKYKT